MHPITHAYTDAKVPPAFIDIEASGFGAESYPIEVGVVLSTGDRYCALIRPYTHWTHWDTQAERLHGLDRTVLARHGRTPGQVCDDLNALLAGQTVFSDGWVVDLPWLITLFANSRKSMQFRLSAIESLLTEAQLKAWDSAKAKQQQLHKGTRHRASSDAQVVKETYLQVSKVQGPG